MMRHVVIAVAILMVAAPGSVFAGELILHPSGFGEHSYASWKAQEGLTDTTGVKNAALYFQKMTTTATFAAGVAVFEGFAGLATSSLTELSFWVGMDGHCGAGAPRFNVRVRPPVGPSMTFFFGCNSGMIPAGVPIMAPNGRVFVKRTAVLAPLQVTPGTITSIALVFDEGDDQGVGFAHLDDITVGTSDPSIGSKTWTSASDNGNG